MTRVWVKSVNQGGPASRAGCARCPAGRRQPWGGQTITTQREKDMRETRRRFIQGVALGAAALSLPLTGRARAAGAQAVRYGGSAWLGHYPAWLAIQAGYFKAEGLDVGWESFGTIGARVSALLSGNIDMAVTAAPAGGDGARVGTSPSSACRRISAAWKADRARWRQDLADLKGKRSA